MKYHYIAAQIEENGKFYAYVIKTSGGTNLLVTLDVPGIVAANICPTRKRAREIATYWNNCFKNNGTYLFDEPKF